MMGFYYFAFNGAAPAGGLLAGWLAARVERRSRSPSAGRPRCSSPRARAVVLAGRLSGSTVTPPGTVSA